MLYCWLVEYAMRWMGFCRFTVASTSTGWEGALMMFVGVGLSCNQLPICLPLPPFLPFRLCRHTHQNCKSDVLPSCECSDREERGRLRRDQGSDQSRF